MPLPWCAAPSHDPVDTVLMTEKSLPARSCIPTNTPDRRTTKGTVQAAAVQPARELQ